MTKSLMQLRKAIASLQKQAALIHAQEVQGVIARIKEAVQAYDLSAADLGFGEARGKSTARQASRKPAVPAPRYRDAGGNEWSGRGRRPGWVREALGAGRRLDEFMVQSPAVPMKRPATTKRRGKVRFRDDQGNSWTGHGRRPEWFKKALAGGKTREQLAA